MSNVAEAASQRSEAASLPWRFYLGWGLAALLGLVWLAAGVIKALEPFDFVRQVAGFQLVPGKAMQTAIAWGLLVAECALGAALILGYRLRWALVGAGCLTLIFMGALGWVILAGVPVEDCGCFGSQVKRSPREALLEDSLMLLVTIVSGWLVWKPQPTGTALQPRRWRGLGVLLCAPLARSGRPALCVVWSAHAAGFWLSAWRQRLVTGQGFRGDGQCGDGRTSRGAH
jgi:uncharacterized membrane protein YphA (DoxX/SURF4 family)